MSKYIPADKLIAEIERRIAAYQKNFDKADNKIARLSTDGRIAGLKALLPFITSLRQEQPEVDLEKEIHEKSMELHITPCYEELANFARHFYECGRLNARKEE